MRSRRGFSLMELMGVIVLSGVIAMISFPKIRNLQRRTSVTSAKMQLRSYVSTARLTALRRGATARMIRSGNTLAVTVDSSTASNVQATIVRPFNFKNAYGVVITSTVDSVVYSSRGLAKNLSAAGEKFYVTSDSTRYGQAQRDSLCLTRMGLVLDGSCGL